MAQVVIREAAAEWSPAAQTVRRLLGVHGGARAESKPGHTDHLTTSLVALERLGASSEELAAYAELRQLREALLPPAVSPGRVLRQGWREALGDPAMEQAFRAFFETELVRLGRDAMLREYLPDLMQGVGGAGFHPMIRLAMGLQCDTDSEVVVALAHWATAFLHLGHGQRERVGEEDPRGVLERVRRDIGLGVAPDKTSLQAGMIAVSALPHFRLVLHWLALDETTLSKMAETSLLLFAKTGSEDALHVLAATHALRVLLPWFYDPEPALRYHWQAVAAGYFAMGCPKLGPVGQLDPDSAPAWPTLSDAAIASQDDHVIQAVHCCAEEEAAWGNSLYRAAAARFVARCL